MPERIQLRRTKGWRMPEGAVKVDRSTGWGNPYRAVSMGSGWWATLDLDGRLFAQHTSKADAVAQAVRHFSTWIRTDDPNATAIRDRFAMLRGRDLACWCKPESPCHADVLLELANQGDPA